MFKITSENKKTRFLLLVLCLLLILVFIIGFLVFNNKESESKDEKEKNEGGFVASLEQREFQFKEYNLSFYYSSDWTLDSKVIDEYSLVDDGGKSIISEVIVLSKDEKEIEIKVNPYLPRNFGTSLASCFQNNDYNKNIDGSFSRIVVRYFGDDNFNYEYNYINNDNLIYKDSERWIPVFTEFKNLVEEYDGVVVDESDFFVCNYTNPAEYNVGYVPNTYILDGKNISIGVEVSFRGIILDKAVFNSVDSLVLSMTGLVE